MMKWKYLWLILMPVSLYGQQELTRDICPAYCGEWTGTLEIYKSVGVVSTVQMNLTIEATNHPDTFLYQLQYGDQDVRDYRLVWMDKEEGLLHLDEQNSIIILTYLHGDRMLSQFEVNGIAISSQLVRVGDELDFFIFSTGLKEPLVSGSAEEIPEVKSFPVYSFQKARLTRK